MGKSDQTRGYKAIKSIKKNYTQLEKSLVEQLYMTQELHGTTIGTMREEVWEELFKMIIPEKFTIEHSVFIIDSEGNVSKEVDLAIMDRMYTPYIFRYGSVKFIPIEVVAVVVECKSSSISSQSITEWYKCMECLQTAEGAIARIANSITSGAIQTQKSTRPIRILCTLSRLKNIEKSFDFVLHAVKEEGNESHIDIEKNPEFNNLFDYFKTLNFYKQEEKVLESCRDVLQNTELDNYKIKNEDTKLNSLLTFNFQLNQLLMLINNPMLFPHQAYVNMFNKVNEEKMNEE